MALIDGHSFVGSIVGFLIMKDQSELDGAFHWRIVKFDNYGQSTSA
jgi:hypothetical protein